MVKKCFAKKFGPITQSVRFYEIPEHLTKISTDTNPSFFRMVEYYYHSAVKVCEPALIDYLKKHTHFSDKKRVQRVEGILKVRFTIFEATILKY